MWYTTFQIFTKKIGILLSQNPDFFHYYELCTVNYELFTQRIPRSSYLRL